MKTFKGSIFLGLALAAALLVVSACSSVSIGAGGSPTPSSLTPLQVLQNSAKAMQKLNSVHFVTTSNGSFQANNAGTPTTAATPGINNTSVNVKASGDAALPNQEKSQITLNQGVNLAEIVTPTNDLHPHPKGACRFVL